MHFSGADLMRVRVREEPDPMWEVLLSLHRLMPGTNDHALEEWRLTLPPALRRPVALLHELARPTGYSPDFLTPDTEVPDFATGLDQLLHTPRALLRSDISRLSRVPSWVGEVAHGTPAALRLLGDTLTSYHRTAIAPHWPAIRRLARADHERRAATAMARGFEAVLNGLHRTVRWREPVLEVDYPVEQDVVLDGRGLTLVPSVFCHPGPITLLRQETRPVLVYPIDTDGQSLGVSTADNTRALTSLLGRTRARVLHVIATGPAVNTTELARAAGISLAGASQHATVLREAGLVLTDRRGGTATHRISHRGAALLHEQGFSHA